MCGSYPVAEQSRYRSPERKFLILVVSFSDVAVWYGNRQICGPVSFQVRVGERVFLDGKNGSGKSSLLKLLSGLPIEHTGTVTTGSGLVISYVPQDTSHLMGSLSDFFEKNGLDESLFKAILRKMDFERVQFEKGMQDFSGGQKKKVLLVEHDIAFRDAIATKVIRLS